MKKALWIGLLLAIFIQYGCRDGKRYHDEIPSVSIKENPGDLTDLEKYRQELNDSFKDPDVSPLTEIDRRDFDGLDFFVADTSYRVYARLVVTPETIPFLMPTTTSRKSMERVYGIANFSIGRENFELEVYQSPELLDEEGYEDYLFLPFTDNTNGETTYSGGRYIDLAIPKNDTLVIDFNKAYNPYCVYNVKYSCPIVPSVNHLDTEILAGMKDYKKP